MCRMKYLLPLIVLLIIIKLPLHAQDSLLVLHQAIFENLDPNKITTGILYDKVLSLSNVQQFDGTDSIGVATLREWRQMYFEMNQGAVNTPPLPGLLEMITAAQTDFINSGLIPIAILNANYDILKKDALTDGLLFIQNGKIQETPGIIQPICSIRKVFASTALRAEHLPGSIDFWLSDEFYFTNDTSTVDFLEIDFDDGLGVQTCAFNSGNTVNVNYSNTGTKVIQLAAIFTDGTRLESMFQIEVSVTAVAGPLPVTKSSICVSLDPKDPNTIPPPDAQFTITSTIPYALADDGQFTSAQISIIYAPGNTQLTKPLLLVDGFDFEQKRRYGFGDPPLPVLLCQEGTLDFLRDQCYDIVFVDPDFGATYIQKNAFMLVELLQHINNNLLAGDNSITVVGPSMGGLITRYALAYMEQNNIPHNVSTMVAFDSPHKGGNVPLGVQAMLVFAANYDAESLVRLDGILSPASRQMIIYFGGSTTTSSPDNDPLRDQFLAEFTALGEYPEGPVKIGIANGSGTGINQKFNNVSMSPGSQMMKIVANVSNVELGGFTITSGTITLKVFAVPDQIPETIIFKTIADVTVLVEIPPGVFNTVDILTPLFKYTQSITDPYDNTPGGFIDDLADFEPANATVTPIQPLFNFIPTISSLDLDPNQITGLSHNIKNDINIMQKTPFDLIIFIDGDNSGHSTIPAVIRDFLLDKFTNVFVQNKVFTKEAIIQADNILTAGTNVDPLQITGPVIIESGSNVEFVAANKIIVKPDSRAKIGSFFHAFIIPFNCSAQCKSGYITDDNNTNDNIVKSVPQTKIVIEDKKETNTYFSSFNYPNPFTDHTHIDYYVNKPGSVDLSVSNVYGQTVTTLVNQSTHSTGQFTITFDARNLPAGVYFYTIRSGDAIVETHKMILTK